MANIWLDRHANTQNYLPVASAKKELTQSSRKQKILRELNNKPLQSDVAGIFYSASKSLRHDVLRKQQMKQNFQHARQNLAHQLDGKVPTLLSSCRLNADENALDYWDVPSMCCTESCRKTDQQIWSETNLIDDMIFDKLLNHTTDSDSDYESGHDDSIVEFNRAVDMDASLLAMNALRLLPDDEDASFLDIPAVTLPACSDLDWDDDLLL